MTSLLDAITPKSSLLDHAALLAEPIRCRILLALEGQELAVSELCAVLRLPQSTVSRHLKALADAEWVVARREGTSQFYRAALLDDAARALWALFRGELGSTAEAQQDQLRLDVVLRSRRSRSREFFDVQSHEWDRLRDEYFGRRFDLQALAGLLDPSWRVGDLGCGSGRSSEALAPFVAEVIAVDGSAAMLDAARLRLVGFPNVVIRHGELEALPIADGALDIAQLILALHHLPQPAAVLREAARVLRPGGRLLVIDLTPHAQEELRSQMGHLWLGFDAATVEAWLRDAGFVSIHIQTLWPDPEAKGPALFAARAQKPFV